LNCQALAQQLQGNLTVKDGSKLGISSRYLLACVKQIIICNSSYASTWFSRKVAYNISTDKDNRCNHSTTCGICSVEGNYVPDV